MIFSGGLVIFGIAVIFNDLLDFSESFQYDISSCDLEKHKAINNILHAVFTIGLLSYTFRYSKVHIQQSAFPPSSVK